MHGHLSPQLKHSARRLWSTSVTTQAPRRTLVHPTRPRYPTPTPTHAQLRPHSPSAMPALLPRTPVLTPNSSSGAHPHLRPHTHSPSSLHHYPCILNSPSPSFFTPPLPPAPCFPPPPQPATRAGGGGGACAADEVAALRSALAAADGEVRGAGLALALEQERVASLTQVWGKVGRVCQ